MSKLEDLRERIAELLRYEHATQLLFVNPSESFSPYLDLTDKILSLEIEVKEGIHYLNTDCEVIRNITLRELIERGGLMIYLKKRHKLRAKP